MSATNTYDDPEIYDSIVLAGVSSPGKVTISGHDRVYGWDVKKAPGQAGASTTRTSEDPIEFTCSFYLVQDLAVDVDDFADWDDFATLITSTVAGQKPKALDIYHPDLAAVDIGSVVLKSFGGVVHDGKGGQTIAVKFLEYKPPKPSGGSPNGSSTRTKTPIEAQKKADPDQAALDELAKLTNQYKTTPWG